MRKGFVFIPLLVGLAIVIIASGGYYYYRQSDQVNTQDEVKFDDILTPTDEPKTITPSNTIIPTATPKPTATKIPITSTPKPTPPPVTGCSQFNPENGLTSITINLKEKDGNALVGDWIVKIKPTGNCPGILPLNWGGQINEVIHQPNFTYTSPGMHPGQFRVDVQYHYSGEGFDFDGTSGNHSREVTVSN